MKYLICVVLAIMFVFSGCTKQNNTVDESNATVEPTIEATPTPTEEPLNTTVSAENIISNRFPENNASVCLVSRSFKEFMDNYTFGDGYRTQGKGNVKINKFVTFSWECG